MRKTHLTALVIAALTGLWLLSGWLTADEDVAEHPTLAAANVRAAAILGDRAPTAVRARVIRAEALPEQVKVRGYTQNKRTVEVRAETSGRVVERPVERGDRVAAGALLCRLAVEDRDARVNEAQEATYQALIEYRGAERLKDRGFQSETAIAQARARLAAAQARLEGAKLDVERTRIRAPFAGVVEETGLEIGDYVQPGTSCASIVDLHPMLLVGRVSERDVARVADGASAIGLLAHGDTVAGSVTFVGQQAAAGTRTYRVEVTVPNPDYALRSGITTEIDIEVGDIAAHKISPSVLALDDEGRVGVRVVAEDQVQFRRVDIIADDSDGVWITGLDPVTTLITVGAQFVVAGERVRVELEGAGPASGGASS